MLNLTGQRFGNYQLTRRLGTGGFGEVYLGTHIHLRREAAIKILLNLDTNENEQFLKEARIISRLIHPHIVTVFDYDIVGETPFIVMMYAEQGALHQRYPPGTRMHLSEVVKYISQAAEGLQFAHDRHVIHRDVKPENMLLGPNGDLLLTDFGIAVMWSDTHSIGTRTVGGTQIYMAPEQYQRRPRPASDQYSLAITAYEWLSGTRPVDSPIGLGLLQMAQPALQIPSPRHYVPELPPGLDDVLRRALASNWEARFPSVREFAQELARVASTPAAGPQRWMFDARPPIRGHDGDLHATIPAEGTSNDFYATVPVEERRGESSTPELVGALSRRSAQAGGEFPVTETRPDRVEPIAPPPPPGSLARAPRALALPVTRAKNRRLTWRWMARYTAFLLTLSVPFVAVADTFGPMPNPPAWAVVLALTNGLLLGLLASILCGSLLGKWRGALVSLFVTGLVLAVAYWIRPQAFLSPGSSSTPASYLYYILLPISAFATGWIYERRRHTSFRKSLLSMLIGTSILLVPLFAGAVISAPNSNSALTLVVGEFLVILFTVPLSLLATLLEMGMHRLVNREINVDGA